MVYSPGFIYQNHSNTVFHQFNDFHLEKTRTSTQIISNIRIKFPHEFAKNRLLHLDTNGFSKEFYSELSHITRQFVEKSCYIGALK